MFFQPLLQPVDGIKVGSIFSISLQAFQIASPIRMCGKSPVLRRFPSFMCLTNLKVEKLITPVIAPTASYFNLSWRIDINCEKMAASNDAGLA